MSTSSLASAEDDHKTQGISEQYWLGTLGSTAFSGLHVRYHGSGVDALLLVDGPPKFLRFHLNQSGQLIATSWKHESRFWGLRLVNDTQPALAQWEEVQMQEGQGDKGFAWEYDEEHKQELLVWRGTSGQEGTKHHGWMVCEWKYGHPQLFWMTEKYQGKLPPGAEQVVIVKKPLITD